MTINALSALLGFVFWIIAARFYSAETVGVASAIIAAMGLMASFANLGLGHGLIRFLPNAGQKANSLINSSFTINILASLIVSLVFLAGLGFWSPELLFLHDEPLLFSAFAVFTIAFTLKITGEEALIANRRSGFLLIREIILNTIRLTLVILLAGMYQSFGIYGSWGISLWVAIICNIVLFLPKAKPGYRPRLGIGKEVKEMVRFSSGNYVANLLVGAPTLFLPIMVLNLLSAESTAYFYIAWSIAGIITTFAYCIAMPLFVEGSFDEQKLKLNVRSSLKIAFLVLVPTVVLLVVFADKILLIFGDAYSENAATLIRILAFAAFPMTINSLYMSIKKVEKNIKLIIAISALVTAGTLILSYFLMPVMGITGAGIGWLASQGIVAVGVMVALIRYIRSDG